MTRTRHRPVIGITAYVEPATAGVWVTQPGALVPHRYVDSRGGRRRSRSSCRRGRDADDDMRAACSTASTASSSPAGPTSTPVLYDAEPHPTRAGPAADRDALELALSRVSATAGAAGARHLPGDAGHGGRGRRPLEQHLPDVVGHDAHSPAPASTATHPVRPSQGTRLAGCSARRPDVRATTTSRCDPLRAAYRPSAWAADGTLEAMEDPAAGFRLAVQWHPEAGDDGRLFDALVAAARRAAVRRAVPSCAVRDAPGDNRRMTKLNRLAIAAGAASALGALAAAGKGVNDAMGARPAGPRLEQASVPRPTGRAPSTTPRAARRRCRPASATCCAGSVRTARPVARHSRSPW